MINVGSTTTPYPSDVSYQNRLVPDGMRICPTVADKRLVDLENCRRTIQTRFAWETGVRSRVCAEGLCEYS